VPQKEILGGSSRKNQRGASEAPLKKNLEGGGTDEGTGQGREKGTRHGKTKRRRNGRMR